jgi:hypothetical protein
MSEAELSDWSLFDLQEPITLWEQRQQFAELLALTYNRGRGTDRMGRAVPAMARSDFLVQPPAERRAQSNSNMVNALMAIAKPYSGKKRRRQQLNG